MPIRTQTMRTAQTVYCPRLLVVPGTLMRKHWTDFLYSVPNLVTEATGPMSVLNTQNPSVPRVMAPMDPWDRILTRAPL